MQRIQDYVERELRNRVRTSEAALENARSELELARKDLCSFRVRIAWIESDTLKDHNVFGPSILESMQTAKRTYVRGRKNRKLPADYSTVTYEVFAHFGPHNEVCVELPEELWQPQSRGQEAYN